MTDVRTSTDCVGHGSGNVLPSRVICDGQGSLLATDGREPLAVDLGTGGQLVAVGSPARVRLSLGMVSDMIGRRSAEVGHFRPSQIKRASTWNSAAGG